MPWLRPTLTEELSRCRADLAGTAQGQDGLLPVSNLRTISIAGALGQQEHYGYLDWIAKQATPWNADGEYLIGWAALKQCFLKAATYAAGTWSGTGEPGTLVPAGTPVTRKDAVSYVTDEDLVLGDDGTGSVGITAVLAGAAGNCGSGVHLTLAIAIAGVNSEGRSSGRIVGGADVETLDELKTRSLQAWSEAPAPGGEGDYRRWAREVAGVTRAWVTRNGMGAGTVIVYFMMDAAEAAHDGIPQGTNGVAGDEDRDAVATGDQLAVADFIYDLQPVTALVYAAAPTRNDVDFVISGLADASAAVKDAIRIAIADVFFSVGRPGGRVLVSDLEAAIGAVPGARGFVITSITPDAGDMTDDGSQIKSDKGAMPFLGTVTYP